MSLKDEDECYYIKPEHLTMVLSSFFKGFKGNPLHFVPMDEAIEMFNSEFGLNEDGNYQLMESDFKAYGHAINALSCDRMMGDMYAKGLVDIAHDGTDWVWIRANPATK